MKIVIVTDAWRPQVNGVVRTCERTREELLKLGHEVAFITPLDFRTLPMPTYPDIRLSLFPGRQAAARCWRSTPRTRCTSPPRARSGSPPRALVPETRLSLHHLVPHPVSRNTCGCAPASRSRGATRGCAGSTARRPR
ncbi:MAG: hypothetical protein MZV65_19410 [Chromatiales bacterium]|nr:hypothetical protein [Chromatiales bacterium]